MKNSLMTDSKNIGKNSSVGQKNFLKQMVMSVLEVYKMDNIKVRIDGDSYNELKVVLSAPDFNGNMHHRQIMYSSKYIAGEVYDFSNHIIEENDSIMLFRVEMLIRYVFIDFIVWDAAMRLSLLKFKEGFSRDDFIKLVTDNKNTPEEVALELLDIVLPEKYWDV